MRSNWTLYSVSLKTTDLDLTTKKNHTNPSWNLLLSLSINLTSHISETSQTICQYEWLPIYTIRALPNLYSFAPPLDSYYILMRLKVEK